MASSPMTKSESVSSNLSKSVVATLYESGEFMPGVLRRKCVWLSCILCLMPTVDYISDVVNAGAVLWNNFLTNQFLMIESYYETRIALPIMGQTGSGASRSIKWAIFYNIVFTPMISGLVF